MNEHEKRYNDLIEKIKELKAKESRSAEESEDLANSLEEAKGLQNELREIAVEAQLKALEEWGKKAKWETIGKALVADDGKGLGPEIKDYDETAWMSDATSKLLREPSYCRDWVMGMRKMFDPDKMGPTLTKALQEGRDDYGGYWTPVQIMAEIIRREPHPTEILANVRRLTCGTDKLLFPKFNYTTDDIRSSALTTQWTGELGSTSEDTSLQAQGMLEIPMHEGTLDVQMSRSWMEDQSFDVGGYIRSEVATAFNLDMDAHIVSATYGTGVARPRAILLNPGGTDEPPTTNVGNPVGGDGIFDLWGALPGQYRKNARWLSNDSTVWADLAQIKAGSNEYIGLVTSWNNNPLANARVDMILNAPIVYSAFMPAAAGAANILVLGDFQKGYGFCERVGLSAFPYGDGDRAMLAAGLVGIMFRFRVGGRILNPRAMRVGVQS